ncbi:hypothetical protein M5E86_06655 [Blautia wexlerae]|nr:hypothetical protein M5E86_06655 [Blautia wexlerae]
MMVDHAPFFDVNRQVVLKVLNSSQDICKPGGTGVSWSKCVDGRLEYIGYLMYNEYVIGKYINRQIMMAVPKVILFVHKNGRI